MTRVHAFRAKVTLLDPHDRSSGKIVTEASVAESGLVLANKFAFPRVLILCGLRAMIATVGAPRYYTGSPDQLCPVSFHHVSLHLDVLVLIKDIGKHWIPRT
jgi:hypothetical protein